MKNNSVAFKIFLIIVCLPIIYGVSVASLPLVEPYVSQAAMVSAGMTFLEGGKAIVLHEDSGQLDFKISDTEPVVYAPQIEEPVTEEQNAVLNLPVTTQRPANSGLITRKTFTAAASNIYIPLSQGFIKNCTSISKDKIASTVAKKPSFKIKANGKPEVLIMHTHATESYQSSNLDWFSKEYSARTTDNTQNMIAVGDKIQAELEASGIGVIHDKTLHDYPSYNGSYERSAVTVKRILKENPTIKIVLDVHRDAIQPDADNIIAPVVEINGESCAQVMIISGCDNGKMNMPNYMENLKFSALLQSQMEKDYQGLTRPILFDYRKYNQDLTTGSILLEMGGHANTLDEALYCGELVGKSLATALTGLK